MPRDVDAYATTYTMESSFEPYMVKYRRRLVLENIERFNPSTILEIGCGMEPIFPFLKPILKYIVVEPAVAFADHAESAAKNVPFVSILRLPLEACVDQLKGQSFDLILASGVLHEVPDPTLFLNSIKALCGHGTKVHVNVPNSRSLHRRVGLNMGALSDFQSLSPRAERLQQHTAFDRDSLLKLLTETGFRTIEEGGYFIKPFTHEQMGRMVAERIIDDSILDSLYLTGRENPEIAAEIFVNMTLK